MNLTIVGTGYVGLVTAACFAEFGYSVTCVDKDNKRLEMLKSGKCPFFEPGLDELLDKHINKTKLISFKSNIKNNLQAHGDREVKSIKIGNWVMEELKELDKVAYVRFASVYRSFEDVRSFLEEIEKLEHELPPELKRNQLDLLESDGDEN